MRKLVITCLAATLSCSLHAQSLFTYGNGSVTKQEFLRGYQKNSIKQQPPMTDAALREYLNLYSLFRMKVREAELMHIDTLPNIKGELDNYRRQLARNYLTDDKVTDKLVKEAYDRMKEEIHVTHILISAPAGMSPNDTLIAYKRIDSIYNAVTKGKADFAALATQYTDDKGSKANGGDIGFITSLQTVYPFENNVYNTPVGKVSAPFRSQFGYHILKVIEKRPTRGEVQVAHILVLTPKSKGDQGVAEARKKLDSARTELKNGVAFSEVAHKYSEDKFTNEQGGVMQPFSVGKYAPQFENAAFALKNVGDISDPVQTDYGIHLMRLIKKTPLKPFDSLSTTIKRRVDNDSRSQVARDIYFESVKQKNKYKEYPAALEAVTKRMEALPDTGKMANTFVADDFKGMKDPVFSLGNEKYSQHDFVLFANNITRGRLMGPKAAVMHDLFTMYVRNQVNDYQERALISENEDFRNLMEEYRNGIMLFELMDRNVWGKASKDSAGLKAFYEKNKVKYTWDPGFKGSVFHFKDDKAKAEGLEMLGKKDVKDEEVMKALNKDNRPDAVTVQHGRYEFTHFKEAPQSAITANKLTEPKKNDDGSWTVVKVEEVYNTPGQKSLDDARGYAVADYQDFLEKKWHEELRTKYPVKVNEDVFKGMVKN